MACIKSLSFKPIILRSRISLLSSVTYLTSS